VRVDTSAYSGCEIPLHYDPIFAKLVTWGADRSVCVPHAPCAGGMCDRWHSDQYPASARRAQRPRFHSRRIHHRVQSPAADSEQHTRTELHDLAGIAAVAYLRRTAGDQASLPERLWSGWHQDSRHLPE
jgi:acetyl-CoA carboxylase biotin carboxylase subunit